MTHTGRPLLDALDAASAFKAQPGRTVLGRLHVPFDALTAQQTCEARAASALAGHRRVVVSGGMGAGKSSLIEWLVDLSTGGTLRPETERYFPIRVPLRIDAPEVATDPRAFLAHLAATIRRASDTQLGVPIGRGVTTWTVAPKVAFGPAELSLELAREVDQSLPAPVAAMSVHLEALIAIFTRLEAAGLQPVVVFDDADAWLDTAWQPDAAAARERFFCTVPRLLAEELDVASILAALPSYLVTPAFQQARDFLGPVVTIPTLAEPAMLGTVLAAHARAALADDSLTAEAFVEDAALVVLHERYRTAGNIRRVLSILDTALTRARDQDGSLIERRDILHAVADLEG